MLNNLLIEHCPQYLAIPDFDSLEQFNTYHSRWWNKEKGEDLSGIAHSDAGEEIDLSGKVLSDVMDINIFTKNKYLISWIAPTIIKAITDKQQVELQQVLFNSFLSEANALQKQVEAKIFILEKYPFILTELLKLISDVTTACSHLVQKAKIIQKKTPKIQWLGSTKLLTTLIYDLWKGQDKGKGNPSTPPLIRAEKKDLMQLLLDNFIDENGEPLKGGTISEYLNTSKPHQRVKKGVRIEI